MRKLLVIAACLSVSGCDAFYTPQFDIHRMQEWRLCRNATGAKVEAHLSTEAKHCGVCGNACGDGVTCIEGECNYSTRIHCGGAGRTCIGFPGGVDVDCVYVGDADFDRALGPVVRGYACVPVASTPIEPIDEPVMPPVGDDAVEPVEQIVGDPPLEPDWILVPRRSTNCRERVDRSCYFTEVEVRDVRGESCTAHEVSDSGERHGVPAEAPPAADAPAHVLCDPPQPACVCPKIYAPVCGLDGATYANKCAAACAHADIAHEASACPTAARAAPMAARATGRPRRG